MVNPNAAPNEFSLSLAPEIDALGLGDRVTDLGADGPVEPKDLIGFRFGVADGTPVPSAGNPAVKDVAPREGVPEGWRQTHGYEVGLRVAGLLQSRGRMTA